MWSGVNQGINGTLINPVGLLLLSNQYGEGDKGNIMVGADVSWKVAKRATIQAQLAIDDLQIQSIDDSTSYPNRWAFTVTGFGALGRGLSWQALYTQASNLAFRTYGVGDNFEDGGVGIGRGYPDMDYLSLGIGIPIANRWMISPDAVFQRQGPSRITDPTPQDPADIRDTPAFLSKPIEYGYRLGVTFSGRQGPLEMQGSGGLYYVDQRGKRGRRERRAIRGKDPGRAAYRQAGSAQVMRDATPLTRARAAEIAAKFTTLRVAVVGDLMLDRYLLGDIERISPEAPVPVVLRVAAAAMRWAARPTSRPTSTAAGARCHLVGVVGNDAAGAALRDALRPVGIDGSRVLPVPGRPTTTKTRVVARGQQVCRVDEESRPRPSTDDALAQVTRAGARGAGGQRHPPARGLRQGHACARADPAARSTAARSLKHPGGRRPEVPALLQLCRRHRVQAQPSRARGGPRRADRPGRPRCYPRGVSPGQRRAPPRDAGCGRHGAGSAKETVRIPGNRRAVYDVSGAGDTVTAWVGLALAAGASIEEAAVMANVAAGIEVGKPGVATVSVEELLAAYDAS